MSATTKNEVLLQADKLTRRFGGLVANQDISVTLERQMIHVLLGPNGAGKSTCINMLSGDLPPSEGRIHFMGKDITGLTAAQRGLAGHQVFAQQAAVVALAQHIGRDADLLAVHLHEFDGHHRVQTSRHDGPGHDLHALACAGRAGPGGAGKGSALGQTQRQRFARAQGAAVEGEAIHGRVVVRWHADGGDQILGEHTAQGVEHAHALGGGDGLDEAGEECVDAGGRQGLGVVALQGGGDLFDRLHGR